MAVAMPAHIFVHIKCTQAFCIGECRIQIRGSLLKLGFFLARTLSLSLTHTHTKNTQFFSVYLFVRHILLYEKKFFQNYCSFSNTVWSIFQIKTNGNCGYKKATNFKRKAEQRKITHIYKVSQLFMSKMFRQFFLIDIMLSMLCLCTAHTKSIWFRSYKDTKYASTSIQCNIRAWICFTRSLPF